MDEPMTTTATKRTNKVFMLLRSPAFRASVFGFIPWIATLYFVIKTLQASAAQAYASLLSLNDKMPQYMVGLITNVSTSDNLKSFGDMVNYRSAYLMLMFTAVVLGLFIIFLVFFSWILVGMTNWRWLLVPNIKCVQLCLLLMTTTYRSNFRDPHQHW